MASSLGGAATLLLTLLGLILLSAAQPTNTQHPCSGHLLLLLPCLPFVQGAASTPPPACCHGLATVFVSQPDCACGALDHAATFPINRTLARQLPLACNLAGGNSACTGGDAPNPAPAEVAAPAATVCPSGTLPSSNREGSVAAQTSVTPAAATALWILAAALLSTP